MSSQTDSMKSRVPSKQKCPASWNLTNQESLWLYQILSSGLPNTILGGRSWLINISFQILELILGTFLWDFWCLGYTSSLMSLREMLWLLHVDEHLKEADISLSTMTHQPWCVRFFRLKREVYWKQWRGWIFNVQLAVEQCAASWGEGVARACWLEGGGGSRGGSRGASETTDKLDEGG